MGRGILPALLALAFIAAPAHAAGPTAVVTMGDSYISGEAGRWAGNSVSATPGNDGTDRACRPAGPMCQVDRSLVYGTTADGCHRSDTAEVLSASLPVQERINISCSGAVTTNLVPAEGGGKGQNGEPPQGDQLRDVARTHDVKAIVVSIGGNDLGFAGIIARCLAAYNGKTGPCKPTEQPKLAAGIPTATKGVEDVIASIRAVMRGAGYKEGGYRLILQTYPSVAPRASELRYPESGPDRTTYGCGNYDVDATWARDEASKEIGDMVADAAKEMGTELLDVHDLFQGHEICAKTTSESTPTAQPDAAHAEWGRFVGASTVQQGQLQEAFHPNAYGQQALGACLTRVYAAQPGTFKCDSRAGAAPGDVGFLYTDDVAPPLATPVAGPKPRLRVTAGTPRRRGARTCVAVRVRAGGKAVRRATVRFGGGKARTGKRGQATVCGRPRAGKRRVVVTRAGYRKGTRAVRVRRR